MDIKERIAEAERKFNQLQKERDDHLKSSDDHLKSAEDCLTEMTKLQGEWRVLQDLLPKNSKKINKANVIDAVPKEA